MFQKITSSQLENWKTGWHSRAIVIMLFDMMIIAMAFALALLLRFDLKWSQIEPQYIKGYSLLIIPSIVIVIVTFWVFKLYHSIWSFASFSELSRLMGSWMILLVLLPILSIVAGISMPASYWLIGGLLAFFGTTAIRFSWRFLRLIRSARSEQIVTRVMLVGAGDAGRALIREIKGSSNLGMNVICVIDDNPGKWGRYIEGIRIVGGRDCIADACEEESIDQIILAIPSAPGADRKDILDRCRATGRKVLVVPGTYQIIEGDVSVSKLREVRIEDLLGRDSVRVDSSGIEGLVSGKCILVTGGGGSIGSELCRQVAKRNPSKLIIFDIYENNAYAIQQELIRERPGLNLVVLIGSVRDDARVKEVFAAHRPDVVFHAAAHKHVPLMEVSPREAVKNNVLGTLNVARAAVEYGTKRMVLISTDKAVNPTNVMGATKRLCEMVIQAEERRARKISAATTFSAVRFGNVLGSNGSVVPLFKQQIAEGGPVTVTDPRITRFFMTIPEAVSLVLQSACYARGGEIFVLDMGEPVLIDDMARKLIRLAGLEPDVDIRVVYTGLRPGEKLYEERLMAEEGLGPTPNELIHVAEPMELDDKALLEAIHQLDEVSHGDSDAELVALLEKAVPTFHPELAGDVASHDAQGESEKK